MLCHRQDVLGVIPQTPVFVFDLARYNTASRTRGIERFAPEFLQAFNTRAERLGSNLQRNWQSEFSPASAKRSYDTSHLRCINDAKLRVLLRKQFNPIVAFYCAKHENSNLGLLP